MTTSLKSFGAYSLNNFFDYVPSGIPFIRGVNMKNGLLDFNDMLYISEDANRLLWKSEVHKEDILLSMSGTIGDVAIAMPNYHYPMNSNQDIAKIHLKHEYNPYYVYAFLVSKYGHNYLIREARGSVQQHVFLSQMENFAIPLFSDDFQSSVERQVKSAHKKLADAKRLYADAERLLLDSLGLLGWEPKNEAVSIRRFSDFTASGRLDAEYYQPKYDEIEAKINEHAAQMLKTLCFINDKNFMPKDETEYDYIELSDIGTSGEITGCTRSIGRELPTRARRIVHIGDVILSSIEGSLQSCALITDEYDGALCSNGFYVVKSDKINSETLLVLMKSAFMQSMMKKRCRGTILTGFSRSDLDTLPIPKIDTDTQNKVAKKIRASFALRAESRALLDEAKRRVEEAIEHGEK